MRTIPLALALAACTPDTPYLEVSCPDHVGGENLVDEAAAAAALRVRCYRRFVGLSGVPIDRALTESVTSHAAYLQLHRDPLSPSDPSTEDAEKAGFTGVDQVDRARAAGFEEWDSRDVGFWEAYYSKRSVGMGPEAAVAVIDDWVARYYYRAVLLQPAAFAFGWGQSTNYVVADLMYDIPPAERTDRPVIYPRDGQMDVPTTYVVERATGDGVPEGERGYPITLQVGTEDRIRHGDRNPYLLTVIEVGLYGPQGRRDVYVVTPEVAVSPFHGVAIVPAQPLRPDTEYSMIATLAWGESGEEREVWTTFTTVAE